MAGAAPQESGPADHTDEGIPPRRRLARGLPTRIGLIVCLAAMVVVAPSSTADPRSAAPSPMEGVRAVDGRLVDLQGRDVLLRGVNVVDKSGWQGSLAAPMLDADKVRQLAAMGFNHVRFGTNWEAIEHERGVYDERYISQLRDQLDLLGSHGMSAVLDIHQDTWSSSIGANGAPSWADPQCNSGPDADLDEKSGAFFLEYLSPAVSLAFTNFWNDGYGSRDPHCTGAVQTAFVDMWEHLAGRLGDHPAVLGYDILNEPWPGYVAPGLFESEFLGPFYERVTAAIRKHDADKPVFFEPVAIYQHAVPYAADAPDPNSVFAPHLYGERESQQEEVTLGGASEEIAVIKSATDARRLGVPRWIGEWGNTTDSAYVRQMYDLFDRERVGSSFWANIQQPGLRFPEDAALEAPHVRPYVELHPGEASWTYDADSRSFTATVTTSGPGVVQLVVPPRLGLRDITVTAGALRFAEAGRKATTCGADAPGPCRATWTLPSAGTASMQMSAPMSAIMTLTKGNLVAAG